MKRLADKIFLLVLPIIGWGMMEIVETKALVSRVDERTKMLIEYFQPPKKDEPKKVVEK